MNLFQEESQAISIYGILDFSIIILRKCFEIWRENIRYSYLDFETRKEVSLTRDSKAFLTRELMSLKSPKLRLFSQISRKEKTSKNLENPPPKIDFHLFLKKMSPEVMMWRLNFWHEIKHRFSGGIFTFFGSSRSTIRGKKMWGRKKHPRNNNGAKWETVRRVKFGYRFYCGFGTCSTT